MIAESTPAPAEALAAYLGRQVAAAHAAVAAIDDHVPEGVHDLRVALRRLRATLRSYRRFLDAARTEPVRQQLREVAQELGAARDAQVVHARLAALLADESDTPEVAKARRHLAEARASDERAARQTALRVLGSPAFAELMQALDRLAADPPTGNTADVPPLPPVLARERRRVRRHARDAETADEAARPLELHETRKATKRLRYTAEAAAPATPGAGLDTEALVHEAKMLQTLLGDHHDTVLTRARLTELLTEQRGDEVVLRRLYTRERRLAERLEQEFPAAWHAVTS